MLALTLTFSLLSGCKDSLQEDVFSFVSAENFYKTASDAEATLVVG